MSSSSSRASLSPLISWVCSSSMCLFLVLGRVLACKTNYNTDCRTPLLWLHRGEPDGTGGNGSGSRRASSVLRSLGAATEGEGHALGAVSVAPPQSTACRLSHNHMSDRV